MEDYQLYEPIATGKTATIYKARKRKTLQYVAVKRVGKEELPRIRNSIAALYALHHPNVLGFVNWYATSKHVWTVTEYCAGGDLSSVIATDGCLPAESVRLFAADVVAGLSHVHSRGFLMAELRPGSVLLDENGSLKLANFTFAQRIDDNLLSAKSKTTATALQYTPPELLLVNPETLPTDLLTNNASTIEKLYGNAHARACAVFSRAADLYALGVLIFEMALGMRPFGEPTANQAICSIITENAWGGAMQPAFDALESSCPALADLIRGLLRKDPLKRFAWAQVVSHPFWCGNTATVTGPPVVPWSFNEEIHRFDLEPHFAEYVAQRAAVADAVSTISAAPPSPLAECDMSSITNANATVLGIVSTPTKGVAVSAKPIASTESSDPARPEYGAAVLTAPYVPQDTVAMEDRGYHEVLPHQGPRGVDIQVIESENPDMTELAVPHDDSAYTYADSLLAADMAALALNASGISNTEEATEWRAVPSDRKSDHAVLAPTGHSVEGAMATYATPSSQHQRTSTPLEDVGTPIRSSRPVDWSLLTSAWDRRVEPIAGVRTPHVPAARPESLPFEATLLRLSKPEEPGLTREVMQGHLTDVYRSFVKGDHTLQLNILSYCFQSITVKPEIANWLVNSSLLRVLLRLAEQSSSVQVQARAAIVVGMVLRQASIIVPKVVYEAGLLDSLLRCAKGKGDDSAAPSPIIRYSTSAFAELVFYICTQIHRQSMEGGSVVEWRLAPEVSEFIVSRLSTASEESILVCRDVVQLLVNVCALAPMALVELEFNRIIAGLSQLVASSRTPDLRCKCLQAIHLALQAGDSTLATATLFTTLQPVFARALKRLGDTQHSCGLLLAGRASKPSRSIGEPFAALRIQHEECYWLFATLLSCQRGSVASSSSWIPTAVQQVAETTLLTLQQLEDHVSLFTKFSPPELNGILIMSTVKCIAGLLIYSQTSGGLIRTIDTESGMTVMQEVFDVLIATKRCQRVFTIHDDSGDIEAASECLTGMESTFNLQFSEDWLRWMNGQHRSGSFASVLAFMDRVVDDSQHMSTLHCSLFCSQHLRALAALLTRCTNPAMLVDALRMVQLLLSWFASQMTAKPASEDALFLLQTLPQAITWIDDSGHAAPVAIIDSIMSTGFQVIHQCIGMCACNEEVINHPRYPVTMTVVLTALQQQLSLRPPCEYGSVVLLCLQELFARATGTQFLVTTHKSTLLLLLKSCTEFVSATRSAADARMVLEMITSETCRSFADWDAALLFGVDQVFQLVWNTSIEAAFKVFESTVDILFIVRTRPREIVHTSNRPLEATLRSDTHDRSKSVSSDTDLVHAAQDLFAKYVPAAVIAMLEITLARPGLFPESVTGAVIEFLLDFARLFPEKCASMLLQWTADSASIASEFAGRVANAEVRCDSQYRNPLHALHAVSSSALKNMELQDKIGRMLRILCKENAIFHRTVASMPALMRHIAIKS